MLSSAVSCVPKCCVRSRVAASYQVEPQLLEALFDLLIEEKLVRRRSSAPWRESPPFDGRDLWVSPAQIDMACDLIVSQSNARHPLPSQCFIIALEQLASLQNQHAFGRNCT